MLFSRFWYVLLAIALGAAAFVLFLATAMYDRSSIRAMGEALAADSQVVASYLRDDARRRATALVAVALDDEIRGQLARASASNEKIPAEAKDKARSALRKLSNAMPAEQKFDALFAVDQHGRVVAQVGFDSASNIDGFELGGYPVVADALHGWVRDDAWVLGGRIYRVVARPVENDVGSMPAGAVVGARIVDDSFAHELSKRTGAAVAFYASGRRVSSGAPEDFDAAKLDTITTDLRNLDSDPNYKEKGTSDIRTIHDDLGVVYARLSGEAWDLGAGYAVARAAHLVQTPLGLLHNADDKDVKKSVPFVTVLLIALLAALIGLVLSYFEHTRPLAFFRSEAAKFGGGQMDSFTVSRFRGAYRQIASHLNDGIDKVAAKGGTSRKAADLEQVLGPIPAQPALSAFSLPTNDPPSAPTAAMPAAAVAAAAAATAPLSAGRVTPPGPPLPGGAPPLPGAPRPPLPPAGPPSRTAAEPLPVLGLAANGPKPPLPGGPRPAAAPPARPATPASLESAHGGDDEDEDEATVVSHVPHELVAALVSGSNGQDEEQVEWRRVFDDFVRTKHQCGEPTDALTFEKFQTTLRKNRDQLIARHACKRVKFSVYVKEGRAALKASPLKD